MTDAFLETLIVMLSRGDTGNIAKDLPSLFLSVSLNLRKTPIGLFLDLDIRDFSSSFRLASSRQASEVGTEH